MKVLVIGSGGREHALVWKIAQSPLVDKVYCAPGNPGTGRIGENIDIKVDDLPVFDAAPYLDSEGAIAAYLTDILAANDAGLLAAALGDIARARGMTEIAKSAGITREALYKALRPGSEPRFDTINRVCTALGVRLVAQPTQLG